MKYSSSKKTEKNTVKNKVKTKPTVDEPKAIAVIGDKALNTFIGAINDCGNQTMIHIEENKLRVCMVDIGNVYLLSAECECKTEIESGAPSKIGIDANLLKKILMHSKGSNIRLIITPSNIEIEYGRFTAKVPPVDTMFLRKEPNPPTISLETSFEMPGKYLYDACKLITSGGKMYIYVKNKVVFLAAHEGDLCVKEVVGTVDKASKARSLYSNDYLSSIAKCVRDTSLKVDISIDHPVRITAEKNDCKIEFLLAPRIEAD